MRCEVGASHRTPPDRKQGKGSCPLQLFRKGAPPSLGILLSTPVAKRNRAAPDLRALLKSRSPNPGRRGDNRFPRSIASCRRLHPGVDRKFHPLFAGL